MEINNKQIMYNTDKSLKKRNSKENKIILWDVFDTEINPEKKQPLECIYRKYENREYCDTCKFSLAFSEEGFLTCTNNKCGIIYKDMLDQGAEWRYYGADDNQSSDPTRCGMPINPLLEESSFGCKVICNGSSSYEMRKIRRYTEWQSMPYHEKSRYEDSQHITIMAQQSGIPKLIIDDAIAYYKKISEYKQTFRGDNKDGLIAASVYLSCRINNCPRTAKELATIFHLDSKSATHGCKMAQTIINDIEKNLDNKEKTNFAITKPDAFIERYCSRLNINSELTNLSKFIAMKIEKKNLMPENTPNSIAAGVVYFISQFCSLNISKKDIKNISDISEVTINKCYKKLEAIQTELLPAVIINKYNSNNI